ncbi:MAG: hypothetical protein ACLR4Z_12670 [Butyricicoccaceae bacterium]
MWADASSGEIPVRAPVLPGGGTQTAKNLHSQTITPVRASPHRRRPSSNILPGTASRRRRPSTVTAFATPGRTKTVPKPATVAEYARATALEALFGFWLYLKQRYDQTITKRCSAVTAETF